MILFKPRFLYHLLRFSKDPGNTAEVFRIADVLRKSLTPSEIAKLTELYLQDPDFHSLYHSGNHDYIEKPYDLEMLLKLPPTTLGRHYGEFMKSRGLNPEFFPYIQVSDVPSYFALRMRKTHDVWHVLAGFEADVPGEIGLMGFYQGQYLSPFPLSIIVGALLHVVGTRNPNMIRQSMDALAQGYEMGKRAKKLFGVPFEHYWAEDLAEFRERFAIAPITPSPDSGQFFGFIALNESTFLAEIALWHFGNFF